MRFLTLFLIFFSSALVSNGQTVIEVKKDDDPNKVYTKTDVDASFPAGDSLWRNFLKENLKKEIPAKNGAAIGVYTVVVKFIVSKDGSVADVFCEKDPGYGMCEEAMRLIKKAKKWIPAKQAGVIVNAYHRERIIFNVE